MRVLTNLTNHPKPLNPTRVHMKRVRLDDELIAQGFCSTRDEALRLCMAGLVSSEGERLTSAALKVLPGCSIHVKGRIPFVSRGGLKLEGALDAFGFSPTGLNCLDIGCSTGGFTDCLLKRGAAHVTSVDVGRAQFDWALRCDERVDLHERTNIVDLPALGLQGVFDLAVCDVSFTSIRTILPATLELLNSSGVFITLVKPQFEAPASDVGEGGIVRDPSVHYRVLCEVIDLFAASEIYPVDICVSPIHGAKGNREFFLYGDKGRAGELDSNAFSHYLDALKKKAGEL